MRRASSRRWQVAYWEANGPGRRILHELLAATAKDEPVERQGFIAWMVEGPDGRPVYLKASESSANCE